MSIAKFYHAENCNRFIQSQGQRFTFEPYDYFGGTWRGLLVTSDPKEQQALDVLVADPLSAITEVSQEVYEAKLKKKLKVALENYNPLVTAPLKQPQPIVEGSRAMVVENPSFEPVKPLATSAPLPKAKDALVVGAVAAKPEAKKK